jgi:Lrp/AsnC family transcriptional regulator, leucine-responsive regulatory protein
MTDKLNRHILTLLQQDARMSHAEMGRRVGLSATAVADRIRTLENEGAIESYNACVNAAKLGFGITAFITISSEQCKRIPGLVEKMPEVLECHRLTGETSALLKVVVEDVDHLERLIDVMSTYGKTNTSIVLSTAFKLRPLPALRKVKGQ